MGSRKLHLVPEYNVDVLSYLFERLKVPFTQKFPALDTQLQVNPGIPVFLRNQAAQWLLDRSPELNLDPHTTQLAVTILHITLARMSAPKAVLQLIVVICLMIAVKYYEGKTMTLDQVVEQAGGHYRHEEVIATELFIMEKLEWTMAYPTAAELGRQLVYITGVEYNFEKILERSEAFESICYADYSFLKFSPITIAVVCVTFALEQYKQIPFRNQWLKLLNAKLRRVNFEEADRCKLTLLQKLYRETPEAERSKLALSEESLSGLVAGR